MPRFYFVITEGRKIRSQNEGLDLADSDAAWVEATSACGELLRELDGGLVPGDEWSMQVKDESGAMIYLLEFKTRAM